MAQRPSSPPPEVALLLAGVLVKKKNRKAGSKKVHIKLENHSANGKLAFILYKGKTFGVRELPLHPPLISKNCWPLALIKGVETTGAKQLRVEFIDPSASVVPAPSVLSPSDPSASVTDPSVSTSTKSIEEFMLTAAEFIEHAGDDVLKREVRGFQTIVFRDDETATRWKRGLNWELGVLRAGVETARNESEGATSGRHTWDPDSDECDESESGGIKKSDRAKAKLSLIDSSALTTSSPEPQVKPPSKRVLRKTSFRFRLSATKLGGKVPDLNMTPHVRIMVNHRNFDFEVTRTDPVPSADPQWGTMELLVEQLCGAARDVDTPVTFRVMNEKQDIGFAVTTVRWMLKNASTEEGHLLIKLDSDEGQEEGAPTRQVMMGILNISKFRQGFYFILIV